MTTAVITFANGTQVLIAAEQNGYFLHLITTTPGAATVVTHIQACTVNGTIIAEGNPLG
ncbi:MAG: hypothetical protein ABIR32_00035 [Ilumatobacteraceae bacterium]